MIWRIVDTDKSLQDPDFFRHLPTLSIISNLELWLGVIVICIPTLGPLFHTYIKPVFAYLNIIQSVPTMSTPLKDMRVGHGHHDYRNIDSHQDLPIQPARVVCTAGAEALYDPRRGQESEEIIHNGIHVRHDFESHVS